MTQPNWNSIFAAWLLEKICAQDACLEEIIFKFMRTKMKCFCDKFQKRMMPPFASTVLIFIHGESHHKSRKVLHNYHGRRGRQCGSGCLVGERRGRRCRNLDRPGCYQFPSPGTCGLAAGSLAAVDIVRYRHGGGWSRKINAWYLYTLMVYL